MFFHAALIFTAASMVIYSYGLMSPFTAIAFFAISLVILAVAASRLKRNTELKQQSIDDSENKHFLSAQCFRTYTDANGALWLRDEDIRKRITTRYTAIFMARKYRQYFRKANPLIDAWYVHPKALKVMMGVNHTESESAIVQFLENQVIGVHYGLLSIGGKNGMIPEPAATVTNWWFTRFWNGELNLLVTLIIGGIPLYLSGVFFDYFDEAEFVMHYQKVGIIYLSSIIITGALLFWWGHGIILSAQHWLASSRSVLVALAAILLAIYLVHLSLKPFVNKYDQYSFAEWLAIATDSEKKAAVYFDPQLHAIIIEGRLGFGTTIKLLDALQKEPSTRMIGLKSYGGRADEGFSIFHIILARKLDTYAWAECQSACAYAYVAGKNRYISEKARFGLHRSGVHWEDEDKGADATDYYAARLMRYMGVQEWLITEGMVPSIHGIYEPSVEKVLEANLATDLISNRPRVF